MAATQGFSHICMHASTPAEFEKTIAFYEEIGFRKLLDQLKTDQGHFQDDEQDEGSGMNRKAWLKLQPSDEMLSAPMAIKLILCTSAVKSNTETSSLDLSLVEEAMVFVVSDLEKITEQMTSLNCQFQASESKDRVYALDPLNNVILFTTHHSFSGFIQQAQIQNESASLGLDDAIGMGGCRRKIAVLTSGGDAPGMNSCVRAVVRYGISKGCEVYAVYEGYQGLVDGGNQIRKMDWKSVRGWLHVGGTLIGTARCMAFKTREGRLLAAENLVRRGIDSLVVCGGDGSLTGADVFRSEWSSLLSELVASNRITREDAEKHQHLTIVGLVGSIDNDMSSTDITIGATTSLHRICEAVDCIDTTASSHSRAFVIEVMGRHCGWLALMAGIATGADFVFIPERPAAEGEWESELCAVTQRHRHLGKRKTIIIVAEGAIDTALQPIKAEHIKTVLTDRLGLDTRVTTLGHVQRGGSPCAADRVLATIQGVAAVQAVLNAKPTTPSPMIGMSDNTVTCKPLMTAVELTHEVAKAIAEKNFARAMELRDPQFAEEYDAFNASTILDDESDLLPVHLRLRIGILHLGAPSGGMNAATRTAVRYALNRGHHPLVIFNGFSGLVHGCIEEATWIGVDGWTSRGGSELGTNRAVPGVHVDMGMVAYQLQKYNIQGLMVIGGFEAFRALVEIQKQRKHYPSLCIPICHLPATISNNVPGTDHSLGTDTGLNAIMSACDAIVQSAQSSRRRVFVVEVQGGKTGYLAVESGLATGANTVYVPEEGISLARLQSDIKHLMALYLDDDINKSEGRIILKTESVSDTYTTDVVSSILKEEGHQLFDSRTAVLGHIQQGDTPSPLDRIWATRLAKRCVQFFENHSFAALDTAHVQNSCSPIELNMSDSSIAVIGLNGTRVTESPVTELLPHTDLKNRKPRTAWWYQHRPLVDLLAGRGMFTRQAQATLNK